MTPNAQLSASSCLLVTVPPTVTVPYSVASTVKLPLGIFASSLERTSLARSDGALFASSPPQPERCSRARISAFEIFN